MKVFFKKPFNETSMNDVHYSPNYESVLVCPYCDSDDTHQRLVRIYSPEKESSVKGLSAVIGQAALTVDTDLTDNPSIRRDGLIIEFECEGCNNTPKLAVYQHKGQTYIHWVI